MVPCILAADRRIPGDILCGLVFDLTGLRHEVSDYALWYCAGRLLLFWFFGNPPIFTPRISFG